MSPLAKEEKSSSIRQHHQVSSKSFKSTILLLLNVIATIYQLQVVDALNSSPQNKTSEFKLDCEPGEQRLFNYESATKVWSSDAQQVRIRASLKLNCMEAPNNSTLKYLVEILDVVSEFRGSDDKLYHTFKSRKEESRKRKLDLLRMSAGKLAHSMDMELARAEPIFEEVGEAISETADRVKRSVSDWFSKTWGSMKDFFVNIFTSSEKSTSTREEVLNESGLDITGQCKATSGSRKPHGLPIDDSVFDDLAQPEYYMGASLDSTGHTYQFNNLPTLAGEEGSLTDEQGEVSFFDNPKTVLNRVKRGTPGTGKQSSNSAREQDQERLLKIPFILIQNRTGKVVEVRFSDRESDVGVKNFKRHLCDLFTTNLDQSSKPSNRSEMNEISPLGKHTTKYLSSTNATSIEQTLIKEMNKASNPEGAEQSRQMVKVLALVGLKKGSLDDEGTDEGRSSSSDTGGQQEDQMKLSVLRTINTTSQIHLNPRGSGLMSPSNENPQVQVNVRQFQQISEGRMTGSAGQLSMSLVDALNGKQIDSSRSKRSAGEGEGEGDSAVVDMADLVRVSSSFSIQLVPATRAGRFGSTTVDTLKYPAKMAPLLAEKSGRSGELYISAAEGNKPSNKTRKREPLVSRAPAEPTELQRTLDDWRQLETRLRLKPSSLQSEQPSSPQIDNQIQRLELLREQIQLRLNEQFLRISFSRAHGSRARDSSPTPHVREDHNNNNELGLSLSQLILDSGSSYPRKKGSMAGALEEVLELEWLLNEDTREGSVSRLLRETARLDKLRSHCKGAISSPLQLVRQSGKSSSRARSDEPPKGQLGREQMSQCQRILSVLLRANQQAAGELALELLDLCNEHLLSVARDEELGHGPASRYYRQLRQQFTELLAEMRRPSESLVDKLLARLPPPVALGPNTVRGEQRRAVRGDPGEFSIVPASDVASGGESAGKRPAWAKNMSMLASEDDLNSDEAAGVLIMTLTSLAAKPSIGRAKRMELVEKLLSRAHLANQACLSEFSGAELDTLESMANFEEPQEELAAKLVEAAKRCPARSEQYLLACIHGLQGQTELASVQRYLGDLLRSQRLSCTLKSEILFVLLTARQNDLFRYRLSVVGGANSSKSSSASEKGRSSEPGQQQQQRQQAATNKDNLDRLLADLVQSNEPKQARDQRCLGALVAKYLSLRRSPLQVAKQATLLGNSTASQRSLDAGRSARKPRAIPNEEGFWDEAHCKRWSVPLFLPENPDFPGLSAGNETDLIDEFDDNSVASAIAYTRSRMGNARSSQGGRSFGKTRSERLLLERENELNGSSNSSNSEASKAVRRRQKCTASKSFGPKNAQASIKAELVNELVGLRDENKFLARFRLATKFLGHQMDIGRMYLWHQRRTTRAHVNILGKSLWDTARSCGQKAPSQIHYMPLFDFSLWLIKLSVGLRLHSQMGFFSECSPAAATSENGARATSEASGPAQVSKEGLKFQDELELYPSVNLRASAEASARFVLARAGMSVAGQYGYRGNIRVSKQPDSCMNLESSHQPMNLTFSSWFQLWDGDCHYWGSRGSAEPQAVKWRLTAKKPSIWLQNECLVPPETGANIQQLEGNLLEAEQQTGNSTKKQLANGIAESSRAFLAAATAT